MVRQGIIKPGTYDLEDDFEPIKENPGPSINMLQGRDYLRDFRKNVKLRDDLLKQGQRTQLTKEPKLTAEDLIMMNVQEKEDYFKKCR